MNFLKVQELSSLNSVYYLESVINAFSKVDTHYCIKTQKTLFLENSSMEVYRSGDLNRILLTGSDEISICYHLWAPT